MCARTTAICIGKRPGPKEENERQSYQLHDIVWKQLRVVLRRADVSEKYLRHEQRKTEYSHIKKENEKPLKEEENNDIANLSSNFASFKSEEDKVQTEESQKAQPPGSGSSHHMTTEDVSKKNPSLEQQEPKCPLIKKEYEEPLRIKDEEMFLSEEDNVRSEQSRGTVRPSPHVTSEWDRDYCGRSQADCDITSHFDNDLMPFPNDSKFWGCSDCGKKFSSKGHLKVHFRIHTEENSFTCLVCGKCFSKKASLTKHRRKHAGEKLFACSVTHTGVKRFGDDCGESQVDSDSSLSHFPEEEEELEEEGEELEEEPSKDNKGGHPSKCWKCSQCGNKFASKRNLKVHTRTHTCVKRVAYSVCGEGVSQKICLKRHTEEEPDACSICVEIFSQKADLRAHKRNHTMDKDFVCSICGKIVSSKACLITHALLHTGEKLHACSVCGKRFFRKSHVTRHEIIHTGEKLFACLECGRKFLMKSHLKEHHKTHTGEQPFACLICKRRFAAKGNLTVHIRTHTGETPFECSLCGLRFGEKKQLSRHVRKHGQKPFACSVCGAKFYLNENLIRHARTHTGEKPFSCSVCCKSFTFQHHIKSHKCVGNEASA
ncbi:oocyte zinc finger protein XlCOF6-like isoform X1 [Syngnathus typhle]|uniref:oocyte zinc finger protein XlCOF6-like isoform X1 n=2 Tax=Syngnathus typhle TaxID=161592 RepID=UPI002A6A2B6F|nr:oocyte zinc finger protein XlCOF6-like isoform X1 [Syngnathus typhle]